MEPLPWANAAPGNARTKTKLATWIWFMGFNLLTVIFRRLRRRGIHIAL